MFTLTQFSSILSSSDNPKNGTEIENLTVRKIGSDTNLFGYTKSKYTLDAENKILEADTIGLNIDLNQNILKAVSFGKESKFELSNGIKYGSSIDEIKKKMGPPIHDKINLHKSKKTIGFIDAFVYEKLLITFDENRKADYIFFGAPESS